MLPVRTGGARVSPELANRLPVNPETSLPNKEAPVPPGRAEPPAPPPRIQEPTAPAGIPEAELSAPPPAPGPRGPRGPAQTQEQDFQSAQQAAQRGTEQYGRPEERGDAHAKYDPTTGQYVTVQATPEEAAQAEALERGQQPTFNPNTFDLTGGQNAANYSKLQEISQVLDKGRQLTRQLDADNNYNANLQKTETDVKQWESPLEIQVGRVHDAITTGYFKDDMENIMNMTDNNGQRTIMPEQMGTISTMMALAEAHVLGRGKDLFNEASEGSPFSESPTPTTKSRPAQYDEPVRVQSMPEWIDSIDAALAQGLQKAGLHIPTEQRNQLAALTLAQGLDSGRYQEIIDVDRQGNPYLRIVPDESMQKVSKDLSGLTGGVLGGYGRMNPSRVRQVSGASQIAGGPQVVGASKSALKLHKAQGNEVSFNTANAVKDMFGSIAERTNPVALGTWSRMANDLIRDASDFGGSDFQTSSLFIEGYSNSPYAKFFKLDQKSFDKTVKEYEPTAWELEDPSRIERAAHEHALMVARTKAENLLGSDLFKADPSNTTKYANGPIPGSLQNAQSMVLPDNTAGGFYTPYSHSIINGRFQRDARASDIMADKAGIRNTLNFTQQEGIQGSMINPNTNAEAVQLLKSRFNNMRGELGENWSKKLDEKFTPNEQQALGLMAMIVADHRGSVNPAWKRTSLFDKINAFTTDDWNHAVEKGGIIQAWLAADPQSPEYFGLNEKAQEVLLDQQDGILDSRGELQDKVNLWVDAWNLAQNGNTFYKPGALATFDGIQNGVMLTSAYSGAEQNVLALSKNNTVENVNGTLEPTTKLQDLRGLLYQNLGNNIGAAVSNPEAKDAFIKIFQRLEQIAGDKKGLYDSFSKNPIMQFSYGKDASQFRQQMSSFYSDNVSGNTDEKLQAHLEELRSAYPNQDTAETNIVNDLRRIMEVSLRNSVGSEFTEMNKAYGMGFTLLNRTPNLKDVTGDSIILGKAKMVPKRTVKVDPNKYTYTNEFGEEINIETQPSEIQTKMYGGGEHLQFQQWERKHEIGFAKTDEKLFWNKEEKRYEKYNPGKNSGAPNQMGVVMVQATDAALLKLMMLEVNKHRDIPLPVRTIHDSLQVTPRSMLHYVPAYNNVAIPQALKSAAGYAKAVDGEYKRLRAETLNKVSKLDRVPIGTHGEYQAISNYFDEIQDKFFGPKWESYRDERFVKGSTQEAIQDGRAQFDKAKAKSKELLMLAQHLGWVPSGGVIDPNTPVKIKDMDPKIKEFATVSPEQFKQLLELAESKLFRKSAAWVEKFEGKVNNSTRTLLRATKGNGIGQMSQ